MILTHFDNLFKHSVIQVLSTNSTLEFIDSKILPFIISIKNYHLLKAWPRVTYLTNLTASEVTLILSLFTCICSQRVTRSRVERCQSTCWMTPFCHSDAHRFFPLWTLIKFVVINHTTEHKVNSIQVQLSLPNNI